MVLRTLLVWVIGVPVTIVLFFAILVSAPIWKADAVHSIARLWCRIILILGGVKVIVKGKQNIPRDETVVFISNHQGAFDIPALQAVIPLSFRWVAKKSLFNIPFFGWSMTFAGYVSIERENAQSAGRSLVAAIKKIKSGTSVVIFPEGTRSDTGVLLPFKRGGVTLASKSGVRAIPIAITGTKGIMKRGSLKIHPATIRITFGAPIETKGVDEEQLRNYIRNAIAELLEKETT